MLALPQKKKKLIRKLKSHISYARQIAPDHILFNLTGIKCHFSPFQTLVTPLRLFQSAAQYLCLFYYSSPALLCSPLGLRWGAIVKVTRYTVISHRDQSLRFCESCVIKHDSQRTKHSTITLPKAGSYYISEKLFEYTRTLKSCFSKMWSLDNSYYMALTALLPHIKITDMEILMNYPSPKRFVPYG